MIKRKSLNEEIEHLLVPEYVAFFKENPDTDTAYLLLMMQQVRSLNRITNALSSI